MIVNLVIKTTQTNHLVDHEWVSVAEYLNDVIKCAKLGKRKLIMVFRTTHNSSHHKLSMH